MLISIAYTDQEIEDYENNPHFESKGVDENNNRIFINIKNTK